MSKQLGIAERAVYERLRRGPLMSGEATLFTRQVGALIAARIARRRPDGGIELVNATQLAPPAADDAREAPPHESGTMPAVGGPTVVPVMPTLSARVSQDVLDYLDSLGHTSRGAALRAVFDEILSKQNRAVYRAGGR